MMIDFLAGILCGSFALPVLVRRLVTGRWDGWIDAHRHKPPVGTTVLACLPGERIRAVTYNGPAGGGDIPEDAPLVWRPMPPEPYFRVR